MNSQFFSLKDLIEMEEYPPLRILNLAPCPEQIEVKHVTSIERMTKGFIRRGEFVLTTATSWNTPEKFLNFVQEIYFGGAVAIAFSFLDNNQSIPEPVIKFAQKNQFTLIQLPWQYRFADIISHVQKRMEHQYKQIVESWSKLQNELLMAYLNRMPLEKAVAILAAHLHADVLMTDRLNCPLVFSGMGSVGTEPMPADKLANFHFFVSLTQRGYTLANVYLSKQHVSTQELESFKPFSSSILVPIMLWFDRDDIIKSTRTQLIDDLIWELASGSFRYNEDDYTRARMLGLHLNVPYRCIVGYICNIEGAISNTWLDENIDELKRAVIQARWSAMVTIRNRYIVAYIGSEENPDIYIERFDAAIKSFAPYIRCAWGVSGELQGKGFDKLYQEAKLCANICQVEKGPGYSYSSEDTRIFHILLPALKSADALRCAKEYLAPLLALEPNKREDLISILNCYFANNFNTCETARTLYYNRQTLRYKIKKVEELFGISLEKHEQALYLELCLRLHELDKNEAFQQM